MDPATDVHIDVIGPARVRRGGEIVPLGGPQQRRLLAALLLRPGTAVPRDQLLEWLEDDPSSADAHRALRMRISRLRTVLGGDEHLGPTVRWDGHGYLLVPGDAVIDVVAVRAAAAAPVADDPAVELARMACARELFRGEPYLDVAGEPWASAATTAVAGLRRELDERWAAALLATGEAAVAADALRALVDEEPFRERRWDLLMRALYRSGRQREALLAYQELVDRFDRDLGLRPGPRLRELEAAILAHDPALDADGDADADADASCHGVGGARRGLVPPLTDGRLPVFSTPVLGRQRDLAAVADALAVARLVTVTGPGGVGKTRLAVAVAGALRHRFWDGVWFVDLSAARPGDDLAALVAADVVGRLREGEHDPVEATRALSTVLSGRVACLVLDNAEQVAADVRGLVDALLAVAGSVRVLVTSRVVLGSPGERVVEIGPLDARSGRDLLRARAADRGAPPVALDDDTLTALCRRLDGLPLALELAAGWLRALTPPALLARLDADGFLLEDHSGGRVDRHRTLDASMAWSYALLGPCERHVHETASLFAGPWTVADVAGAAGLGESAATAAVTRLVDASLVHPQGDGWYRVLPVVASYGRGQVEAGADGGDRWRALADLLIGRSAQLELALRGPGYPAAIDALEAYEPTVQQVLDRLRDAGDADRFAALVATQGDFWYASGRRRRAIERCDQALTLDPSRTVARARVLTHAAGVRSVADVVANRGMLEEAIEVLAAIGETEPQTWAALFLVVAQDATGDSAAGTRWLEHARTCAGADPWSHAVVDVFAATHCAWAGEPGEAPTLMERAYRAFVELGDGSWQARAQWILATYRRALGQVGPAREALQRAMAHAEAAGDRATVEHARFGLVRLETDPAVAVPALRWCIAQFAEIGDVTCEASARRELARALHRAG